LGGGIAILEMAIVLPLLTFLGMGIAEFGQFFYVRHAFEAATRDAARFAIPGSAKQGDPAAAATATLAQAGITFNASMMTIIDCSNWNGTVSDVSGIQSGHILSVYMQATYSALPNAYRPLSSFSGAGIGSGKVITCQCTMVKE